MGPRRAAAEAPAAAPAAAPASVPAAPGAGDGAAREQQGPSQRLAEALSGLLSPLLAGQLEFRGIEEPRAVHLCRREDGIERQEVCFIRISEPSQKPPSRVRVGGGYLVRAAKAVAPGSEEWCQADGGDAQDAVGCSHWPNPLPVSEGLQRPPSSGPYSETTEHPCHLHGTYTRGESRSVLGDRRQNGLTRRYATSLGPAPSGDAAFRVFSSDRRYIPRGPDDFAKAGPSDQCTAEALAAVLQALGARQEELAEDSPGAPGELQPEVYRTVHRVDGRWSVELCYVCADHVPPHLVAALRSEIDGLQQELVQCRAYAASMAEAAAVAQRQFDEAMARVHVSQETACTQTWSNTVEFGVQTVQWCSACAESGHSDSCCPQPWCTGCGTRGHAASACPAKPRLECGTATDTWCALCDGLGHAAPECPLRRRTRRSEPSREAGLSQACGAQAAKSAKLRIRVGGGFMRGPEVPGLAGAHLDEEAARRALVSARAAGHLSEDGNVHYEGAPKRAKRPSSAPPRRRPGQGVEDGSPEEGAPKESIARQCASIQPPVKLLVRERGPRRHVAMERERERLMKEIVRGSAQAPDGPNGFLLGTYIHGSHDKHHRCASESSSRTAFRVYRSRIRRSEAFTGDDPQWRSGTTTDQGSISPRSPAMPAEHCGMAQAAAGVEAVAMSAPADVPATSGPASLGHGPNEGPGPPLAGLSQPQGPPVQPQPAPAVLPPVSAHPQQLRAMAPSFYQELASPAAHAECLASRSGPGGSAAAPPRPGSCDAGPAVDAWAPGAFEGSPDLGNDPFETPSPWPDSPWRMEH